MFEVGDLLYCYSNEFINITQGKYYKIIGVSVTCDSFVIVDDNNKELIFFYDDEYCISKNLIRYTKWFKSLTDLRIDKINNLKSKICSSMVTK